MTVVARSATRVLLDTSPFITFAECSALRALAKYLGDRACIALDVDVELRRNAAGKFPALQALPELGWPTGEPVPLPPDLLADADALRQLNTPPGAHEDANRGEIATALLGARIDAVAIIDDKLGKRLCRMRGVDRLSTAQLAAEMVATQDLEVDVGYCVFDTATPSDVGRPEFEDAVDHARDALG